MSNFSKISIDFAVPMQVGDTLAFDYNGNVVLMTWAEQRQSFGVVKVAPSGSAIEVTADNFLEAFNADYNSNGLFDLVRLGTVVEITATVPNIQFSDTSAPAGIGFVVDNTNTVPFTITDVSFLAGDTCESIKVSVTTSEQATEMTSPFNSAVGSNPFVFDYDRFLSFELKMKKGVLTDSQSVSTPARLYPSGIQVNVVASPAGSVVTILAGGHLLDFKYSLDGVNYRTSNVFTNVIGGDYTVYVKDQFDCVTQKDFRVDSFGINAPYFYLPTANSIRYAKRVTWGDCSNYKNDENTLSCEVDTPLAYTEIQLFQSCDKIITQFKSNYQTHSIEIKKPNELASTPIPLFKKTNNMRRTDRRDAIMFDMSGGNTGVLFESGNIYDYDTGVVTGDYTLNGALPIWGKVGNFIDINGSWFPIINTIYIDERNAEVLVIGTGSFSQNTNDIPVVVGSFYNVHNYEVYEFEIDMFDYLNQDIQVSIRAIDDHFPEIRYLSEMINVRVRHKNTVEVLYWDDENTDVFFSTGIQNKMRIMLEKSYGQPAGSIDSYDTDTDTILLNADIRQSKVFIFSPMTESMMYKLDEALSHRFVTIDGVPYGDKEIEVSESLGESNLYEVTVTMKKAKTVYRGGSLMFDENAIEIPALIPTDDGFVKYQ